MGEHGELRLIAQRKRKQPFVPDTAEDDCRFLSGLLRVSWSAVEPHDSGQPAQAQPEGALIRQLSPQRDSATLRSSRIDGRPDRVALYGALLEEVGQLGRCEAVLVGQGECVMGSSLTMGTGRGSITRRNRRIPYEGVDVAGLGCVMHKPAGIGVAKVLQSGQYAGVQTPSDAPPAKRPRLLVE